MRLCFLLLALILPSSTRAEDAPSDLRAILADLDAEDPTVRKSAGDELDAWCVKAGDGARKGIEDARAGKSAEVRARLDQQLDFLKSLEQASNTLACLDVFGFPDVKHLEYVLVNTGQVIRDSKKVAVAFQIEEGWLIDDDLTRAKWIGMSLEVATCEKRPSLPKDVAHPEALLRRGDPLPGQYKAIDFEKRCRELIEGNSSMFGHEAWRLFFASRWELQRGHRRVALSLLDLARASAELRRGSHPFKPDRRSVDELLVTSVAQKLRLEAVTSAHLGGSREAIERKWSIIARLPKTNLTDEALEMSASYRRQILEEENWTELTPELLALKPPTEQAAYWIYKLRDVAATQESQPGSCSIFNCFSDNGKPQPPTELVRLGWDAVPLLIEHLEDPQPTRSLGFWRSFAPESFRLLRYKHACLEILNEITHLHLYEDEDEPGLVKKDAERCWRTARDKGLEAAYAVLLDDHPGMSAERLLSVNRSKWEPILLDRLREGGRTAQAMLAALDTRVRADEDLMLRLIHSPNLAVAAEVASWLDERQQSDVGARALLDRLADAPAVIAEEEIEGFRMAMDTIAATHTKTRAAEWAKLLEHSSPTIRLRAMACADRLPSREVIDRILPFLDDRSSIGHAVRWDPGARVCDVAAEVLQDVLEPQSLFPWDSGIEERDALIRTLRARYLKSADSIPWDLRLREAR